MPNTLIETAALFEWRLEQLEFLLRDSRSSSNETITSEDGDRHDEDNNAPSIVERINRLENRFNEACSNSRVAGDLLKLHERLEPILESNTDSDGSGLTPEKKIPIILAAEDSLRSRVSQLATLKEMPFPEVKDLADLIALRPRIVKARQVQEQQAREVEQLRARTIELMASWYKSSILHGGGKWNEIEQRIAQIELKIRREAAARSREENEV